MKKAFSKRTGIFSAALLVLCLAGCNQGDKTADFTRRKAVDKVLANDVPFRDFNVNTAKSDTIELAEGTQIVIPPGIFVDKDGKTVKGDVQIHYRAFYTPGEIIASGISMVYDTADASHIFSSAGMFEITGTQNGKPVSIAPGKSIDMAFASSRNDAKYSFYEMDTTKAQWNFVRTGNAEPNSTREKLLADLSKFPSKPVEPKLYNGKKPVINIDVDITDHPELAGYEGLMWQYAGSGSDPEKNKWIYENDWTSAQLTMRDSNTCMYGLALAGNSKKFSTNVYPVLSGQNYQHAMSQFKEKMATFEAAEKIRQEKRKQVASTQEYIRRTNVRNFGLCNWDMYNIFGTPEVVYAEFHFDDPDFENNREKVAVYFSAVDGRFVSAYNGAACADLTYLPTRNSCLIAILRGTNKAMVLNNSEFFEDISKGGSNKTTKSNSEFLRTTSTSGERTIFRLHGTSQAVSNSSDIDMLITKL
jgi:hypothetical protein